MPFWNKPEPGFSAIAKRLRKRRGAKVSVDLLSGEDRAKASEGEAALRDVVGDYIRQFRYFRYDPSHWENLTRAEAERLLTYLLFKDMAYGVQMMDRAEAEGYARGFLDQFDSQASFLSIGYHTSEVDGVEGESYADWTYEGISQATFESGVIAVDGERIGILWVEDED